MKAIELRKAGGPEVLELVELPKPRPGKGELLIKVLAGSVTKGDAVMRALPRFVLAIIGALFGFKAMKTPGVEYAGVVEELGPETSGFQVGQRVVGTTTGLARGANAEYVVVPAQPRIGVIAPIPPELDFSAVAPLPVGAMTARYLLEKGGLKAGMRVLVHGASGSVGCFAVQLALIAGATVTAVCSGANGQFVQELGASRFFDYHRDDFTQLAGPHDLVFDAAGKTSKAICKAILAPGGRYVSVKSPTTENQASLIWLLEQVAAGKLKVPVDKTISLSEVAEAHSLVDSGHKRGNILVRVSD